MASSDCNDPRANGANQAQRNETNEVQNGAQRGQLEDTTRAAQRAWHDSPWRNRVEDRARAILTLVTAMERANAGTEVIRAALRASDEQYRRSNTRDTSTSRLTMPLCIVMLNEWERKTQAATEDNSVSRSRFVIGQTFL